MKAYELSAVLANVDPNTEVEDADGNSLVVAESDSDKLVLIVDDDCGE